MPSTSAPRCGVRGRMPMLALPMGVLLESVGRFNQKSLDPRHGAREPGDDEEMAAVEDLELRVRYAARQDSCIDEGNDRIVVAGHDECRLLERVQPVDARPAREGIQLIEIADERRR